MIHQPKGIIELLRGMSLIVEDSSQVYTYAQRPKGKTREQVDIAVDALARVSIGAPSFYAASPCCESSLSLSYLIP